MLLHLILTQSKKVYLWTFYAKRYVETQTAILILERAHGCICACPWHGSSQRNLPVISLCIHAGTVASLLYFKMKTWFFCRQVLILSFLIKLYQASRTSTQYRWNLEKTHICLAFVGTAYNNFKSNITWELFSFHRFMRKLSNKAELVKFLVYSHFR